MTVIVRTIADLRAMTGGWRKDGKTSAVIPTMGALHEGHLTLVRNGKKRADKCIATIFINPSQFSPAEDLSRYPRDEEDDMGKLASVNCDLAYIPASQEVYPAGFSTLVTPSGPALAGLEDKFRPHFFGGVATVVAKLFNQCGCDFAMFGEKDYQQLQVVTRMARDLDIPIEVVGVPTVREADGLAMSSRNRYLSQVERQRATAIYRALSDAAKKIGTGIKPSIATAAVRRTLTTQGFRVDYVAARHAETLAVTENTHDPIRLIAAAWIGNTRLIDNVAVVRNEPLRDAPSAAARARMKITRATG
jgi:pantoate--beta-alanine ligase